jgi:hypothetical protein
MNSSLTGPHHWAPEISIINSKQNAHVGGCGILAPFLRRRWAAPGQSFCSHRLQLGAERFEAKICCVRTEEEFGGKKQEQSSRPPSPQHQKQNDVQGIKTAVSFNI